MRILLLGGTGAMGKHLAAILTESGNDVAVTTRNYSGVSGGVRYIKGNAMNEAFLKDVLREKWDAVVDFMIYDTSSFRTKLKGLLDSTDQYFYISTARVYANSEKPITENSPRLLDVSGDKKFIATDEYSLSKARQEDLLFQSQSDNWTVVRPYITYSEKRLQLGVLEKEGWLYRVLKGRPIVFSEEMMSKKTTMTYGLDVARGISALIGQSSARGEVFHITSGISLTWKNVFEIYSGVIEERLGYLPPIMLKGVDDFEKVHTSIYQIRYDRFYDRVFDNSKIQKFIDVNEFASPEVGLKRCLEIFLNEPNFERLSWRGEGVKDKLTGDFSVREIGKISDMLKYIASRYFIS